MDTFSALDASYGALFALDEYREIIQMINSERFEPKIFKKNRRNNFGTIQWNENDVISCDRYIEIEDVPYYIQNIETTTFTINKMVLLGTINCVEVYAYHNNRFDDLDEEMPTEITITESSYFVNTDEDVVLYNGTKNLPTDDSMRIDLPNPIVLRPKYVYHIQMKQTPPNNYCTREVMLTKVQVESDITVKFHNDRVFNGRIGGLVDELQLNDIKLEA